MDLYLPVTGGKVQCGEESGFPQLINRSSIRGKGNKSDLVTELSSL